MSDTLPFELPVGFDNSSWYSFLLKAKFTLRAGGYSFEADKEGFRELVLRVLFDGVAEVHSSLDGRLEVRFFKKRQKPTVPFHFKVQTRNGRGRVLSVPHPAMQLRVARFYEKYRALILHHSRRGNYSLRSPVRVARYTTVRDSIFPSDTKRPRGSVEVREVESRAIHSYFVYAEVASLHRFYESWTYREAEKHYSFLTRLDLSRCFDSIYTHSVAWAVHEREVVKRDVTGHESTFASEFDALMQLMNDNETNGILIGPEVSRIFAEMILQGADRSLEFVLRERGLFAGRDYRILRYVDDYFIFHNDPAVAQMIASELEGVLRPYKMNLNSAKEERLAAPFISPMSIAKRSLNRAFSDYVPLAISSSGSVRGEEIVRNLLHEFKRVVLESGLAAVEITNYSMAVAEIRLEEVLRHAAGDSDPSLSSLGISKEDHVVASSSAILEFLFHVYGSAPLVSGAVKLARAIAMVRRYLAEWQFSNSHRLLIDELIARECSRLLQRMKLNYGVESIYLLDILGELPGEFDLSEIELAIVVDDFAGPGASRYELLEVLALIRYAGPRAALQPFVRNAEKWLLWRAGELRKLQRPSAELVILTLDATSSPWIVESVKRQLVRGFLPNATNGQIRGVASLQDGWFGRWYWNDFYAELRLKRVHEVY